MTSADIEPVGPQIAAGSAAAGPGEAGPGAAAEELEPLGLPVAPRERGPRAGGRRRRRAALWIAAALAVVLAVLIAVLASAKPSAEQLVDSPLIGNAAPELHGSAILNGPAGGAPVSLSSYRGKWVLVNFSASWCVPCVQEMPQLLLFARQHARSGDAAIVTVADDQGDIGNLRKFLAARSVRWAAVDDAAAPVDWGVGQLPDSYVVDPSGQVVAEVEGGVRAAQLDALITKDTAAGA